MDLESMVFFSPIFTSAAINHCDRLTELVVQDNQRLSDSDMDGILLPDLRKLELNGWGDYDINSAFSGLPLESLAENSPLLA
jgi:hypothetical protein